MTVKASHRDHYAPAQLRGVLPAEPDGRQCLSFETEGGEVVRLVLDAESATQLVCALSRYREGLAQTSQSEGSSGRAVSDGSPQDGQKVAPETRSSSAEIGDA
ncbi:hypothetical protein A9320_27730 [Ruegeria sp. PBVC088]|nr:hypothetical protein A9320_27730 [Ruegeria sp. PBVC088]